MVLPRDLCYCFSELLPESTRSPRPPNRDLCAGKGIRQTKVPWINTFVTQELCAGLVCGEKAFARS